MISHTHGGPVIRVEIRRDPLAQTGSDLEEEDLGGDPQFDMDQVRRAVDAGDLEGAWDMFKSAAKKVVAGGKKVVAEGKKVISKAKEKIQNATVHPPQAPAHTVYAHETKSGKMEIEFPPEYYQEMEKFYKLFELFFQATETMWQKRQEQMCTPPEQESSEPVDEHTAGETETQAQPSPVVYYVLRNTS